MKRINRRIARIEKDLIRADSGSSPTHRMLATMIFLALLLGIGLFSMDSALTGYVTFGESFSDIQQYTGTSMFVEESGSREIVINRSGINALTVSGSIVGKGKAAIYLEKDAKRRLVYYFIGDAGDGFNFTHVSSSVMLPLSGPSMYTRSANDSSSLLVRV